MPAARIEKGSIASPRNKKKPAPRGACAVLCVRRIVFLRANPLFFRLSFASKTAERDQSSTIFSAVIYLRSQRKWHPNSKGCKEELFFLVVDPASASRAFRCGLRDVSNPGRCDR